MRLIPGTDGFLIDKEGNLYNPDRSKRNTYVNGDGYITGAVKVKGTWITFGIHRLLAMTFLYEQKSSMRYFVNHIDGNVANNDLDNLEWVSVYENNIHAALLSESVDKPKLIAISPVGETLFIDTAQKACELINCTFKELWASIKDNLLIDGWKIKYNDKPLPKDLWKVRNPSAYDKLPVRVLDTVTKEVSEYKSLKAAAEHFKSTASLLSQTICRDGKIRIFLKRYLVVLSEDEFPDLSDEELEVLRTRISRPVIAINVATREKKIFPTGASFYREYGLSRKSVTTCLRKDKIKNIGGFVFLYMNSKNVQRLENYLSLSGEAA